VNVADDNNHWIGGQFVRGHEGAAAAIKLFPNQGMHDAAKCFAISHERGIQYLEQAPVLALGAMLGGPSVRRTNALYIQHRLVPLCERGAPLKAVLAAFCIPYPLRKLRASALFPSAGQLVLPFRAMDPAVLGRIVPDKPKAQRDWLGALVAWRRQMVMRRQPAETRFAWAAERMALAKVGPKDTGTVADFACSGEPFNEVWQWPRAEEEADRWHARLSVGQALRNSPVKPETPIDFGPHPDICEHMGFDFVALRTPLSLAEEGAGMRHCVGTYINTVMHGDCSIIAIRRGDARLATMELRKGRIHQLKGRANSHPPADVHAAAASYARFLKERQP
jgi:hypothetical protein